MPFVAERHASLSAYTLLRYPDIREHVHAQRRSTPTELLCCGCGVGISGMPLSSIKGVRAAFRQKVVIVYECRLVFLTAMICLPSRPLFFCR
jgi:ribose 5-phosphate isomerase RpiB